MLLLPFVENSFKHGSLKQGILQVNIQLHCEGNTIVFKIENTHTNNDASEKGIGLENIKKRLDLLYKDTYSLKIDDTTELFKVHLELDTTP